MNSRNNKLISSSFNPLNDLTDKRNYRTNYRIEVDGTISERVRLEFDTKEQREWIIFTHIKAILEKTFSIKFGLPEKEPPECPWDFFVRDEEGNEMYIEITAIADSEWCFTKLSRERSLRNIAKDKEIRFGELKRYLSKFPSDGRIHKFVLENSSRYKNSDHIPNPLFPDSKRIFTSFTGEEHQDLKSLIAEAITAKEDKEHSNKDKTLIIIDNQTTRFTDEEFSEALAYSIGKFSTSPFGIVIYTGYYSDDDGTLSEFKLDLIKPFTVLS